MAKQKIIWLTVTVLLLGECNVLFAQTVKPIDVVTTAVPFLRVSPDARAGGMGDLGVATQPDSLSDASAVFWNAARLPFDLKKGGVSLNYSPWLKDWGKDMYLAAVAGYYKLNDDQVIHGSLRYFSPGELQFTDNKGNHLNSFQPREFALQAGYARKLSDRSGLSLSIKYIYSKLATAGTDGTAYKAGVAVAADIGYYYNGTTSQGEGWSFGAALSNLGSRIGYTDNADQKDFIPANLGLGTAYTKVFNDANKVSFGLDINKLLVPSLPEQADSATMASYRHRTVLSSWAHSFDTPGGGLADGLKQLQISVGTEYWYQDCFALRAGYFFEARENGNRKFFTLGAGLRYNIFALNFSYMIASGNGTQSSPLANTLRFGLAFDLK